MTCSAKAKIQNFRSWTNVFDKMPTMIPYQSCALQIGVDGKVLHSLQDRTHLGLLYDMGASRLCCNRQTAPNLEKSYLCCVPLHQSLLKHFWRQRGFWRYGVDPDNRSMQGSLWKTTEHRQGSTKGKNISVKLCHAIGGPEAFSERMLNVIIDRKSANDYALMETESVVEEDLQTSGKTVESDRSNAIPFILRSPRALQKQQDFIHSSSSLSEYLFT